jgi:hypothetical protein
MKHHAVFVPTVPVSHIQNQQERYEEYFVKLNMSNVYCKQNKLSGLSPLANYTRPNDRCLSAKLMLTFVDRGVSRSQRNGSPRP